jgi:hypothetical protein
MANGIKLASGAGMILILKRSFVLGKVLNKTDDEMSAKSRPARSKRLQGPLRSFESLWRVVAGETSNQPNWLQIISTLFADISDIIQASQ